jgi:radical SAM-linked protein
MIPDNIPIKQRLHITFGKFDALVYTSNLDVAKLWERVLRRANLPILYSEGFNPRPRIALASALPLGISSQCELLDVSLRERIFLDGLIEQLTATSPPGLRIYKIVEVPVRSPTLQTRVRSSEYQIRLDDAVSLEAILDHVNAIKRSESLHQERDRKGKTVIVDIRPLILDLYFDEADILTAHLVVGDQGNMRPDELVEAMGLSDHLVSIHRLALHLDEPNP